MELHNLPSANCAESNPPPPGRGRRAQKTALFSANGLRHYFPLPLISLISLPHLSPIDHLTPPSVAFAKRRPPSLEEGQVRLLLFLLPLVCPLCHLCHLQHLLLQLSLPRLPTNTACAHHQLTITPSHPSPADHQRKVPIRPA